MFITIAFIAIFDTLPFCARVVSFACVASVANVVSVAIVAIVLICYRRSYCMYCHYCRCRCFRGYC